MQKMAERSDESSNLLFGILADWNHQLKHSGIDFDALANGSVREPVARRPAPVAPRKDDARRIKRRRRAGPAPLAPN